MRKKRTAMDISIEETAARSGISGRGYSNLERNCYKPKLSNLLAIAAVLDIDLGELNSLKPALEKSGK